MTKTKTKTAVGPTATYFRRIILRLQRAVTETDDEACKVAHRHAIRVLRRNPVTDTSADPRGQLQISSR